MASTTSLSLKYRPARIGLLVRAGNLNDLVTAAGLNTLLAGGIYNPIIPVSTDTELIDRLTDRFNLDALYAVADVPELQSAREKHPSLTFPFWGDGRIFLEDWETKRNVFIPLDIINVIEHYWEDEFRHKPDHFQSDFKLMEWADEDSAKSLYAVTFGLFSSNFNLRDDFAEVFLAGLRANRATLSKDDPLDPALIECTSAIKATALLPRGANGGLTRGHGYPVDGLVIGDESSFDDLIFFWNIRAAGCDVEFLPIHSLPRFKDYIQAHLDRLNQRPSGFLHDDEHLAAHVYISKSKDLEEEERKVRDKIGETSAFLSQFHTKKRLLISPFWDWASNHSSRTPSTFYYNSSFTLANVDKTSGGFSVTVDLKNKPMFTRPVQLFKGQALIAVISPVTEFAYENFTLKFPFIRQLNQYVGVKAVFDPSKVRLEKDGVGVFIDSEESSLTLYPVPQEEIIRAVFEYVGFQSEISKPGLITKRILEKMGGLSAIM